MLLKIHFITIILFGGPAIGTYFKKLLISFEYLVNKNI